MLNNLSCITRSRLKWGRGVAGRDCSFNLSKSSTIQLHLNAFTAGLKTEEAKKSERPVDALAVNPKNINDSLTDPLTAWNQEMLAHLKKSQ